MEGNSFYGTDLVSSVKNAAIRGVRTGAVGFVAGIVGSFRPPFGMARAPPRRGCGSLSPFNTILGYTMARGLPVRGIRAGNRGKEKVQYTVNNYDPVMAQSSIYTDSTGRYLVDGHHTTVANIILNRGTGMNMNQASPLPPSTKEVYWVKKWYELGKTAIKIIK